MNEWAMERYTDVDEEGNTMCYSNIIVLPEPVYDFDDYDFMDTNENDLPGYDEQVIRKAV